MSGLDYQINRFGIIGIGADSMYLCSSTDAKNAVKNGKESTIKGNFRVKTTRYGSCDRWGLGNVIGGCP